MRKMILLVLVVISCFCTIRCEDPYMNQKFAAYEDLPVGLYLNARPEYSEWVKLLKKVGLYDALNIGTKFTCFVADNDAVASYLSASGWASVEAMDSTKAAILVRYHILGGVGYTASTFNGKLTTTTLSGDYLSIKSGEGNSLYVNNFSRIIQRDIKPINGVIHKMDRVLNPVVETVWDLVNQERYSIFRDAVTACGLAEMLSRYERKYGELSIRDYKTVFVVSDSIFKENHINTFDDLKAIYSDVVGIGGTSALYEFIAYHISPDFSDFSELGTFSKESENKVKNIHTRATNQLISIADVNGELLFNRTGGKEVRLVKGHYDLLANNGFVHEIDQLMPVATAEVAVVNWELTDCDAFRVLEYYQKHNSILDGNKYPLDRSSALQNVRWKTVPDNDNAVRYYLRSAQWFAHNDAVTMTLGNVGWAEFDMPVIAKGKYKVTMHYLGYNARGTGRLYFDGMPLCEWAFTSSYIKEIGTIEFSEQTPHIFKIVVVKKGDMEIDQLIFKPIK